VSQMVGSKSGIAVGPGDRKGIAEWSSSVAGWLHDTQRRALLVRISRWCRSIIEVMNLPVSSASGDGLLGP
jgi:hypothetical protein